MTSLQDPQGKQAPTTQPTAPTAPPVAEGGLQLPTLESLFPEYDPLKYPPLPAFSPTDVTGNEQILKEIRRRLVDQTAVMDQRFLSQVSLQRVLQVEEQKRMAELKAGDMEGHAEAIERNLRFGDTDQAHNQGLMEDYIASFGQQHGEAAAPLVKKLQDLLALKTGVRSQLASAKSQFGRDMDLDIKDFADEPHMERLRQQAAEGLSGGLSLGIIGGKDPTQRRQQLILKRMLTAATMEDTLADKQLPAGVDPRWKISGQVGPRYKKREIPGVSDEQWLNLVLPQLTRQMAEKIAGKPVEAKYGEKFVKGVTELAGYLVPLSGMLKVGQVAGKGIMAGGKALATKMGAKGVAAAAATPFAAWMAGEAGFSGLTYAIGYNLPRSQAQIADAARLGDTPELKAKAESVQRHENAFRLLVGFQAIRLSLWGAGKVGRSIFGDVAGTRVGKAVGGMGAGAMLPVVGELTEELGNAVKRQFGAGTFGEDMQKMMELQILAESGPGPLKGMLTSLAKGEFDKTWKHAKEYFDEAAPGVVLFGLGGLLMGRARETGVAKAEQPPPVPEVELGPRSKTNKRFHEWFDKRLDEFEAQAKAHGSGPEDLKIYRQAAEANRAAMEQQYGYWPEKGTEVRPTVAQRADEGRAVRAMAAARGLPKPGLKGRKMAPALEGAPKAEALPEPKAAGTRREEIDVKLVELQERIEQNPRRADITESKVLEAEREALGYLAPPPELPQDVKETYLARGRAWQGHFEELLAWRGSGYRGVEPEPPTLERFEEMREKLGEREFVEELRHPRGQALRDVEAYEKSAAGRSVALTKELRERVVRPSVRRSKKGKAEPPEHELVRRRHEAASSLAQWMEGNLQQGDIIETPRGRYELGQPVKGGARGQFWATREGKKVIVGPSVVRATSKAGAAKMKVTRRAYPLKEQPTPVQADPRLRAMEEAYEIRLRRAAKAHGEEVPFRQEIETHLYDVERELAGVQERLEVGPPGRLAQTLQERRDRLQETLEWWKGMEGRRGEIEAQLQEERLLPAPVTPLLAGPAKPAGLLPGPSLTPKVIPLPAPGRLPGPTVYLPEAISIGTFHGALQDMPVDQPVAATPEEAQKVKDIADETGISTAAVNIEGELRGRGLEAAVFDPWGLPVPRPESLAMENIGVNPEFWQFRLAVGPKGERLEGGPLGEWRQHLADPIKVWVSKEGKMELADGHHRLAAAKRAGVTTILAQRYLEVDGWSKQDMRAYAALHNIAAGSGKPIEIAKYIRDTRASRDELELHGITTKRSDTEAGWALSRLENHIFKAVVKEILPENLGVIIGRELEDFLDLQGQLLRMWRDKKSVSKMSLAGFEQLAIGMRERYKQQLQEGELPKKQGDIFGNVEVETDATVRAELIARVARNLRERLNLFKKVGRKKVMAKLTEKGNILSEEENREEARVAAHALDWVERFAWHKGPVSNILDMMIGKKMGADQELVFFVAHAKEAGLFTIGGAQEGQLWKKGEKAPVAAAVAKLAAKKEEVSQEVYKAQTADVQRLQKEIDQATRDLMDSQSDLQADVRQKNYEKMRATLSAAQAKLSNMEPTKIKSTPPRPAHGPFGESADDLALLKKIETDIAYLNEAGFLEDLQGASNRREWAESYLADADAKHREFLEVVNQQARTYHSMGGEKFVAQALWAYVHRKYLGESKPGKPSFPVQADKIVKEWGRVVEEAQANDGALNGVKSFAERYSRFFSGPLSAVMRYYRATAKMFLQVEGLLNGTIKWFGRKPGPGEKGAIYVPFVFRMRRFPRLPPWLSRLRKAVLPNWAERVDLLQDTGFKEIPTQRKGIEKFWITRVFSGPMRKFAWLSREAGETAQRTQAALHSMGHQVFHVKKGLFRDITEDSLHDLLLRDMMDAGPDSPTWKNAPPDLQRAARGLRHLSETLWDNLKAVSGEMTGLHKLRKRLLQSIDREREAMDRLEERTAQENATVQEMVVEPDTKGDVWKNASPADHAIAMPLWRSVQAIKNQVKASRKGIETVQKEIETWQDNPGIPDYIHWAQDELKMDHTTRSSPEHQIANLLSPRRVSARPLRKRTGRGAETREPSAIRAVESYLRQIIPYIEHQSFLNRIEKGLWGEEMPVTMRDLSRGGKDVFYKIGKYQSQGLFLENRISGQLKRAREVSVGEREFWRWTVALLRADVAERGRFKHFDPVWLAQAKEAGNARVISASMAPRVISTMKGGAMEAIDRLKAHDVHGFIRGVTKTLGEEMMGTAASAMRTLGTSIAFVSSTNKLALSVGAMMNNLVGASITNLVHLGPVNFTRGVARSTKLLNRYIKTLRSGAFDDIYTRAANYDKFQPLLASVTDRLRSSEAELSAMSPEKRVATERLEDGYAALFEFGILLGNRGQQFYTFKGSHALQVRRQKRGRKSLLVRPGRWTKESYVGEWMFIDHLATIAEKFGASKEWLDKITGRKTTVRVPFSKVTLSPPDFQKLIDLVWIPWNITEVMARAPIFLETYVNERARGIDHDMAGSRATMAVRTTQGMYNETAKSPYMQGIGRVMSNMANWAQQRTGAVARMPWPEFASWSAAMYGLWVLWAQMGYDLSDVLGSRLSRQEPFFGTGRKLKKALTGPSFKATEEDPTGLAPNNPLYNLTGIDEIFIPWPAPYDLGPPGDFIRWGALALEDLRYGYGEQAKEKMYRAFRAIGEPGIIPDIERAFYGELIKGGEGYLVRPKGIVRALERYGLVDPYDPPTRILMRDQGPLELVRQVMPGTPLELGRQYSERERMQDMSKHLSKMSRELSMKGQNWAGQMMRAAEETDPVMKKRAEETAARIEKEIMSHIQEQEVDVETVPGKMRDWFKKRLVGELPVEVQQVYRMRSKKAQYHGLLRMLSNKESMVPESEFWKLTRLLGGSGGFIAWGADFTVAERVQLVEAYQGRYGK